MYRESKIAWKKASIVTLIVLALIKNKFKTYFNKILSINVHKYVVWNKDVQLTYNCYYKEYHHKIAQK